MDFTLFLLLVVFLVLGFAIGMYADYKCLKNATLGKIVFDEDGNMTLKIEIEPDEIQSDYKWIVLKITEEES